MPTFDVGDIVHHQGEDGRFVIKKVRENGDLDVFGGLGWHPDHARDGKYHAAWRTFRAKECRQAKTNRKLRVDDNA